MNDTDITRFVGLVVFKKRFHVWAMLVCDVVAKTRKPNTQDCQLPSSEAAAGEPECSKPVPHKRRPATPRYLSAATCVALLHLATEVWLGKKLGTSTSSYYDQRAYYILVRRQQERAWWMRKATHVMGISCYQNGSTCERRWSASKSPKLKQHISNKLQFKTNHSCCPALSASRSSVG